VLFTLYEIAGNLQYPKTMLFLLFIGLFSGLLSTFRIEVAHRTATKVSTKKQLSLTINDCFEQVHRAMYKILKLAKVAKVSPDVKREMVTLLIRLSRKPPRVTINQCISIDRSLLAQVIPSLLSLWIVLVQLNVKVEHISFEDFFKYNLKH
jgi:hypothetical protein